MKDLKRRDVLLRHSQIAFLKSLEGTVSEHIRLALDEYIEKKKREKLHVGTSPSSVIFTLEGGNTNGREYVSQTTKGH